MTSTPASTPGLSTQATDAATARPATARANGAPESTGSTGEASSAPASVRSAARTDTDPTGRTRPERVAIVGAGFIADFHLAILREIDGVEVVAICDPDATRAAALAARFGIARTVGSIGELAGLSVDVAHLLVPPDLHGRLVRELFELGIGAFVEKPFVLSSAEARELGALAAARGVALGVNHNNAWHPAFTHLAARVAAGEIGRVEHVQATLSVPLIQLDAGDYAHWMFRSPRNIVFEQAVHPLCLVHALVGEVESATTTLLGTRELLPGQLFHDRWAIAARGKRGTAQVYLAFGQGFTRNTIEVLGSDGTLSADLFHDTLTGETKTFWLDFWNSYLASVRRGAALRRDARRVLAGWLRFTLGLGKREDAFFVGMRASIRAFYAARIAGAPPPTGATEAAEVLAWCEAIVRDVPAHGAPAKALPEPGPPRAGEVVVLGATGFIGRRVVAKLLDAGAPVSVVARRTHALPAEIVAATEQGRVRFLRGSLEDKEALARAFAGASTVIQLATGGGDTWEKVERSMVKGSRDAAEAALAAGVARFVYVSSIAALYTGADLGAREIEDSTATDPAPEARPLYSRGKIAAEKALLELHRTRGLPLSIVRPGVVVGAGTPMQHSGYGLWTRDNHCIGWGDGSHALPLVWVDDVADALARLARHAGKDLDGKALNLCARVPLSAREIVAELSRASGRSLHFHPRALALSQSMEIGKWLVKKAGRRAGVEFPSWRDLKARALVPPFTSRTAREVLGWKPVEEREGFLEQAIRVYGPTR